MKNAKDILTSSDKFHINLGLNRTIDALNKLGNPQNDLHFIHVAGTNGKGSVCAILNEILCTHFLNTSTNVGLFTSPHLFSYCERIKINGVDILNIDLDFYINTAASAGPELTEFEILTVAAFLYFKEKNVKYVVLEVGLGGMYDSTNVIENPLCSIITTIDYDHTSRLGNTIEQIAYQKAGISKRNCPVVTGIDNAGFNIIKEYCIEVGAELFCVENEIKISLENGINYATIGADKYEFALFGDHQAKNLALVLKCLQTLPFAVSKNTIKSALKNVCWKFRLQYDKGRKLLIDGAHNPSGIKCLRDFLDKNFCNCKKTFVFGCLNNKDYENMLKNLVKQEDEFYFYEFNYPNALKFEQLPQDIKEFAIKCENPYKIITRRDGLCVVCGSLYMLGELFNPG